MLTSTNPKVKKALAKMAELQGRVLRDYGSFTPCVLLALLHFFEKGSLRVATPETWDFSPVTNWPFYTDEDFEGVEGNPGLTLSDHMNKGDVEPWEPPTHLEEGVDYYVAHLKDGDWPVPTVWDAVRQWFAALDDVSFEARLQRDKFERLQKVLEEARNRFLGSDVDSLKSLSLSPEVFEKLRDHMKQDDYTPTLNNLIEECDQADLREGIGRKGLNEVNKALDEVGLYLPEDWKPPLEPELTEEQIHVLKEKARLDAEAAQEEINKNKDDRPELFVSGQQDLGLRKLYKTNKWGPSLSRGETANRNEAIQRLEERGLLRRIDGTRGKGKKPRTEKVRLTPLGVKAAIEKTVETWVGSGALEWVGYSRNTND